MMAVWSIAVVVGRLQWREVYAILPEDDGGLLLGGGCLWLCRCLVCVVWFVSLVSLFVCVVRTSVRLVCMCLACVCLACVWCGVLVSLFGVCRCLVCVVVWFVCALCVVGTHERVCLCECAWAFTDVFPGYVGCVMV
jgi:hypothetical protein